MKTVFMTGAGGDIGKAIAQKFEEENYQVIGPRSSELDLRKRDEVDQYLKNLKIAPDVLVHCAGINNPKLVEDNTLEDIETTFSINLLGFYQIVAYFIPHFKKRKEGNILAISSIWGSSAKEGRSVYAMSKHALNGFVKTLALELGPYNIKVNSLSPGFVDTKLTRKNNDEKAIKELAKQIPLRRLAKPEEIAQVAYFLCSSANTYINGQDIIVDGGYVI